MAEENKVSGKAGLDTTAFKTGTAEMRRELRLLDSGFRASAAELGDWSQSATGLESRIKTLNSSIDIQQKVVAATRAEFERIKKEQGENSRAAQEMEIKLNKENQTLGKMKLELQETTVALKEVKASSDDTSHSISILSAVTLVAQGALAGLTGIAKGLWTELKVIAVVIKGELATAFAVLKVGVGSMVALGAAALGAGVLITGLTFHAATAADQLGELSDKTGITVQRLQELGYIGKITGTDLESVTGANAKMIRSMNLAAQQIETFGKKVDKARDSGKSLDNLEMKGAAEAYTRLGIHVTDATGKLRNSNVVFAEVLDALNKIRNPTERDALAMQIFGKSAQELNPLIKLGAAGLAKLTEEAHKNGAVVDTETVTALGNLNDQLDALKSGLSGVGTTILGAFAPFYSGVLTAATGFLQDFLDLVRESHGDLNKLIGSLGDLSNTIILNIGEFLPQLLKFGLTLIQTLAQSIFSALPDLLKIATQIIGQLGDFILQSLPGLGKAATQIIPSLVKTVLSGAANLVYLGAQILQTLIESLSTTLPGLLPKLQQSGLDIISSILGSIQNAFPNFSKFAVQLVHTLIDFLRINLTQLVTIGIPLISQLIQGILPELPRLVDAALKILVALADAITKELPVLTPVIVDVILQIIQVLADNLGLITNAALMLIQALVQGLIVALPYLLRAAPQIISTILRVIRDELPLVASVAAQILESLSLGIFQNLGLIVFAAFQIIKAIFETLSPRTFYNIGRGILDGIFKGIRDNYASFISGISVLMAQMVSTIQNVLHMHSSSGVGIDIGANFIGSIGMGGLQALDQVKKQFASVSKGLSVSASLALAPGVAGNAGGTTNNNTNSQSFVININATVNKDQDWAFVAQQVKNRIIQR